MIRSMKLGMPILDIVGNVDILCVIPGKKEGTTVRLFAKLGPNLLIQRRVVTKSTHSI